MTDVYSLGVVLFELLTDAKPYQLKRQSDAEWEEAILLADPQKPSLALQRAADADFEGQLAPGLRRRARALVGDLDNIVLKALAKPPEQRYPSVEALALDLQRYQVGKPVQARPQSVGYRLRKFVSRHRWALATGSLAVAVLSASLAVVGWQARQAVQEAARAQAMQDFVTGLFEGAGTARRGEPMDLRALLDAGIVRASRELARQPRARAEVFGVVARLRLGLGDDGAALALLKRQDMILDSLDQVPASLRLESITLQGRAQRQLGEERGCIVTMSPWLATARREQAQIPARVADFYSQLARCHRANGERNLARQLFERALMLRRDLLDDELGVVENQVDLAGLHADAGDHDAAMRGLRGAMARLHDQFGDRHPLAIEIHRQTGTLQLALGDIDAAEAAFRDAAALAAELQGREHPATLALRRRLAELHMEQGRFDEAERGLRAAHPVLVAQLGAQHIDVGSNYHGLGVVAWERGDLAEARRALARAVAIWRNAGGEALLPGGLIDYAAVLHASGRHDEAQRALVEARRLWVERFGERHPLLADVDRMLGEVLASKGLEASALAHFEQARRYTYDAYGPDNARSRRAELALARALARQGDPRALVRIDAIAALPEGDNDTRRLRWRARAYAAEVRCRNGLRSQGQAELAVLDAELRTAMPAGGVIPREVAALLAGCASGTG